MKIGCLHAYPNSDLQFENVDFSNANGNNQDRYTRRIRKTEKNLLDQSLDKLSTVYSTGGKSFGTCYLSGKTPNTYAQSINGSQLNRTTANWKPTNNKSDIYSQFSKATKHDKLNRSELDSSAQTDVLERMRQNEYLGGETFDTFVMRKMGMRPGKRMIFPKITQQEGQRELLGNYLVAIRDKEKFKLEEKRVRVEKERQLLEEVAKQFLEDNQTAQREDQNKKCKFKEDINQSKYQKEIQSLIEKQREIVGQDEGSRQHFPFTHGDHIERQREYMRGELKEELRAKYQQQYQGRAQSSVSQTRPSNGGGSDYGEQTAYTPGGGVRGGSIVSQSATKGGKTDDLR